MEASESTETTESTEAPEPASTEASPPDVGEALQELRSEMQNLASRVPEPPAPEEPDIVRSLLGETAEPEPPAEEPQTAEAPNPLEGDDQLLTELRQMMREEAESAFMPHLQQQEAERREKAIHALAEKYPDLKTPDVLDVVGERLGLMAKRYGQPAITTDPEWVETVYKAYKAEAAAAAETPAEGGVPGASLEQGGAPPAPEPEVSPDEQRYAQAMQATVGTDPLTR